MAVEDPRVAADAIVRLTEEADGRVDDRAEKAQTDTEVGTATLTIRLPAAAVSPTLVALRELGDVESVNLAKKDVTGAAQDLDARIHAMELSVDRMTTLLATATTHDDIITAEDALTEREAGLEQLRSQRAALAEQVSLSTIHVAIVGPDLPPYVAPPAARRAAHRTAVVRRGARDRLGLPGRSSSPGSSSSSGCCCPGSRSAARSRRWSWRRVRWTRRWRGPATVRPVAAGVGMVFDPPAAPPAATPAGPPPAPPVDPDQQQPR